MANTQNYEFCTARADQAAEEASEAILDNVRDRALRSEATWRGLAEHARGVAEEREKARVEKQTREELDA
ncbi:hypothetical protein GRI69_04860 [Erythrobacter vulgaris]|jgi:hypothetical protein|uniref:Uncharacterized protein n=1 Tax=Qipengyuania vulgaris TaxID=291985 RepID=A0A844XQ87_9SPHN|nr:hypothetical protein [Qipengyuania vulgaris]MXO47584.1 hypothetical protein [Qipengyuania vulgaris]